MPLSVLTYNLYGFNNGGGFLLSYISDYNIACVQENWLHEEELTKLCYCFPGYGCISIFSVSPEDISSISCQHPDQGGGQWVWLSGARGVVSGRGWVGGGL